jgi:ArsR family transcriptional regulator
MEIIYSSVKDIERLYKGLGDESRLKIMYMLNELGEACVRDIQQVLKVPQPTVSRHLGLLKRMGLVDNHRRGKWNYYYVVKKQPDIVKNLINCLTHLDSCRKIFKQEMTSQLEKLLPRPKARK